MTFNVFGHVQVRLPRCHYYAPMGAFSFFTKFPDCSSSGKHGVEVKKLGAYAVFCESTSADHQAGGWHATSSRFHPWTCYEDP